MGEPRSLRRQQRPLGRQHAPRADDPASRRAARSDARKPASRRRRPASPGASEDDLFSACWVKQATEHKTREGDVVFATSASAVRDAVGRLRSLGLPRAVVQRHVEGDLVKFYGVGGGPDAALGGTAGASWFRWFYPKEKPVSGHAFDERALGEIACRAADALGLEVWGGDAIVTPDGRDFRDRRQRMAELRALPRRSGRPHRRAPCGPPAPADPRRRMNSGATLLLAPSGTPAPASPSTETLSPRPAAHPSHGARGPAGRVRPRVRARRRGREPGPRRNGRARVPARRRRAGAARGPDRPAPGSDRREHAVASRPARDARRARPPPALRRRRRRRGLRAGAARPGAVARSAPALRRRRVGRAASGERRSERPGDRPALRGHDARRTSPLRKTASSAASSRRKTAS